MIVTCASCLTKFNIDDSKIPAKGTKVRCSRCQHVFFVIPSPERKEDAIKDFESFAKFHEALIGSDQKEVDLPPPVGTEEIPSFYKETSIEKGEGKVPEEILKEEKDKVTTSKPRRMADRKRKKPSRLFALLMVLVLLVFGAFTLWTELGSLSDLSSYIEYPVKKITDLWNQIFKTEKEGLIIGDLNGYEEKIGEHSLFIIEGKVKNQSRFIKKYVKIRVVIFDRNRIKLAEKEILCGRMMGQKELRDLPTTFFKGEMMINPQTEKEMIIPFEKASPFMVIFKEDLSNQAKEFQVEIIEAPNL